MSRYMNFLIEQLVKRGVSLPDAVLPVLDALISIKWEKVEETDGWKTSKPVLIAHDAIQEDEQGRSWRGEHGSLHGLILYPEYKDGSFHVGGEVFTVEDIPDWYHDGNSLVFFKEGLGWVTLESVCHLPPGVERPES